MSPPLIATAEDLALWVRHPATQPPLSALDDGVCLLVDASDAPAHDLQAPIRRLLRSLPCPVIALGSADTMLARACDTCVDNLAAAAPLLANIERSPRAAAVLVQLLRISEGMHLDDALVAESLAYATLQGGAEFRRWLALGEGGPAPAITDEGDAVLIERDGDSLQLRLNRASNRNGMSVEMRDALCEALRLVLGDETVRTVHLSALGKCFSTGGDLSEFGTAPDTATAHLVRSIALPGRLLARCAARVTVTVHGACIGSGIEFPAFAGTVEARPGAWFQLPELKYGLIPGAGGCVSIARRIGRQRTAWMVLSGEVVKARTALSWGLVDRMLS
ncbi:MAG TPA: enoyl-CoA hydratase/isomerase family protein [Fontimonas sp.]